VRAKPAAAARPRAWRTARIGQPDLRQRAGYGWRIVKTVMPKSAHRHDLSNAEVAGEGGALPDEGQPTGNVRG
jgi:hypothetical protein